MRRRKFFNQTRVKLDYDLQIIWCITCSLMIKMLLSKVWGNWCLNKILRFTTPDYNYNSHRIEYSFDHALCDWFYGKIYSILIKYFLWHHFCLLTWIGVHSFQNRKAFVIQVYKTLRNLSHMVGLLEKSKRLLNFFTLSAFCHQGIISNKIFLLMFCSIPALERK